MRAIILSAGQGSRLLPLTADRPKCLIDFSGKTLLDWQLDALIANGVTDISIVVGFRADAVEARLAERAEERASIRTVFNPFYQVADNLGSVWLMRDAMTEDFMILNGDNLISPALVNRALASTSPISVTVDIKDIYDADDMKVRREGERLMAIGKTLPLDEVNAESIGFLVFRGEGPAIFRKAVEDFMRTPEGTRSWYLKVIDRLAPETEIGTVSIAGEAWGEVDFPEDVEAGRALTSNWTATHN